MKKGFYRLPSSRSFAKLLSILTVAVVGFAVLELFFVQQALAGVWCCNSTKCICDASLACPSTHPTNSGKLCYTTGKIVDKGTINSTIECTGDGANSFDSTSFSRDSTLACTVRSDPPPDPGAIIFQAVCQQEVSYVQAGLAKCINNGDGTSTLKHDGFCKDVNTGPQTKRLKVTGTLKCCDPDLNGGAENLPAFCASVPDPTLMLGIADADCSNQFPANADLGVAEGQVLSFHQTFNNSTCSGPPIFVGDAVTLFCNGNFFDGSDPDCTFGTGPDQKDAIITGTSTDMKIQFDVFFSPQVLNVSCNNNDVWRFKVYKNQSLDPLLINESSLTVEGFGGVTCDDVLLKDKKQTYRQCEIPACVGTPNLGTFVGLHRNDDLTFDLTVEGFLKLPSDPDNPLALGTAIVGEQHVTTSGQTSGQ
jgi:hypothetical protein